MDSVIQGSHGLPLRVEIFSQLNHDGSQVGVVVIGRASHLYDPGSSLHVG